MKKVLLTAIIFTLMSSALSAESVTLEPTRAAVITRPEDTRDMRILVYFVLPENLSRKNMEIEYAMMSFEAQVTDAYMGQIEVYPVTTSWKDEGAVSWAGLWEKDGGDYSMERAGTSVTAKSEEGEKKLRSNVTNIVKSWLHGLVDNNGLIIVLSDADLEISTVKYQLDRESITLKIQCTDNL